MTDMQIFDYKSNKIRTIEMNGEPWFVLKDVCEVLGISKYRDVAERLDDDERAPVRVDTPGGAQEMTAVNESGLYNVILRSDKPEAKPFRKWVTSEVLPSIRKNGGYIADQEKMTDAEILANAMLVAQRTIAAREERIAALSAENNLLAEKNEELTPKGEYYDRLVDNNSLMSLTDSAKAIGVKPKTFINFLIADKFLYRRSKKGPLLPYEDKNHGYFEVKDRTSSKTGWAGAQTFTTVKGREKFMQMRDDGYFD